VEAGAGLQADEEGGEGSGDRTCTDEDTAYYACNGDVHRNGGVRFTLWELKGG